MADIQEEQRRVFHAPDDIFDLVTDVRDYPNFIKWIRAMRIEQDNVTDGVGSLTATAIVGYKFVRETFTTQVDVNRPQRRIDVSFVDGPFSILENHWTFHALEDGSTLVDFWIRYRFRNPILQKLIEANVGRAANTLINAFETRAGQRFAPAGDRRRKTPELIASLERSDQQV